MDNDTCFDLYDRTGDAAGVFAGVTGGAISGPFIGVATDYFIDSVGECACLNDCPDPVDMSGAYECGKIGYCDTSSGDAN
ncbi:hypothetical protein ABXN37_20645 [Piscinibacter sakaiensis]|uniref:hypothetical protein n=1 Tax=Piscinibacter sakaiensis TaxID=1547922 RepID=UPI0012FC3D48|nr:hypothetical protein [Piscinibacter sakaiensis]